MKSLLGLCFLLADEAISVLYDMFDFSDAADRLWQEASVRDAAERLAEAEEREEVWEPKITMGPPATYGYTCYYESSPVAPLVSADSASGERPAAPSHTPCDVVAAGHPIRTRVFHTAPATDSERLLVQSARAIESWALGNPCPDPIYYRSLVDSLDKWSGAEVLEK